MTAKHPSANSPKNKISPSNPQMNFQEQGVPWRNAAERIEDLQILSREISSATAKVEHLMKALTKLFRSVEDRKLLHNLISALNKIDNSSDFEANQSQSELSSRSEKANEGGNGKESSKKEQQQPRLPVSQDGDSLFDIINSPSFLGIVDKVMEKKKRN